MHCSVHLLSGWFPKVNHGTTILCSIPLLNIYPQKWRQGLGQVLAHHAHRSTRHNSPEVEAVLVPTDRRTGEHDVARSRNGGHTAPKGRRF